MRLGNFEAAEHHHCRAMALNPSSAYIRGRSANFYTFNHQPERSLELIAEAEALDPFLPVYCLEEKGVALFNLGKYEEAISALDSLAYQTFPFQRLCLSLRYRPRQPRALAKRTFEAISISPDLTDPSS